MSKKSKILISLISFIVVIITFFLLNSHYNKKTELTSIKNEVVPLLIEYYSLLSEKKWSQAKELVFTKEENLWILNELDDTWGKITVLNPEIIAFDEVTTNLYSTKIKMEIYSEELDYTEIINVHPFVALIDSNFKIIINERDIPEQFGIDFNAEMVIFPES